MDINDFIIKQKQLKKFKKEYKSAIPLTNDEIINAMLDYEKAVQLIDLSWNLNTDSYLDQKKQEIIEEFIIAIISFNPNAMYIESTSKNKFRTSLGLKALDRKLISVTKYILADKIAGTMTDDLGNNLGINCAIKHNEELTIAALSNPDARTQRCFWLDTIGMKAAQECLPLATEKALSYEDASIQQNASGFNIGMICAMNIKKNIRMSRCFDMAFLNNIARSQISNKGDTMESIAKSNNYNTDILYDLYHIGNKNVDAELNEYRRHIGKSYDIELAK